jgi:glutaredoxin
LRNGEGIKIENMEMGKEVITFTLEGCKYCEELEEKLGKEGIEYRNIDVSRNSEIGDMIEGTYKCTKYPMVVLHSPNRSIVWLSETELLPSINIRIYDNINQIITEIKYEFNS